MFRNKYVYCLIKFDDEKTYWYRTNERGYRSGMKVIVPVTNNGKWKIGLVVEVKAFAAEAVPYPLIHTKGIVGKAGWLANSKVEQHNKEIERSKYPPIDISITEIDTPTGKERYCTCLRERELFRKAVAGYKERCVLIENYPPSAETDIPRAAQKQLHKRLKAIEKFKREHWRLIQ